MMIHEGERDGPVINLDLEFRAPRDKIFDTWTDPELVKKWFFMAGAFENTLTQIDLRTFGPYTLRLEPLEPGQPTIFHGHFIEVVPGQRLVYTWTGASPNPHWTLVTAVFHERERGSAMSLTHGVFLNEDDRDRHNEGWLGCLAGLERFLDE